MTPEKSETPGIITTIKALFAPGDTPPAGAVTSAKPAPVGETTDSPSPACATGAAVAAIPAPAAPILTSAATTPAPAVSNPAPAPLNPASVSAPVILAPAALKRIQAEMPAIFQRAMAKVESGELALIGWGLAQPRVQKLAAEHEGKPWFFIGDIHGDFLAWHRLFERVKQEKDFRLCFLGDLVDRGPLDLACFAALLEAVEQYPGQIMWILGNHDEGLRPPLTSPSGEKRFSSTVEPAEFVDFLNAKHEGIAPGLLQAWGTLFIDVCRRLPRAVLFFDGLLATHGGVPLEDRWPTLKTMEAFHHPRCLGDFTWTRATGNPIKSGWKYDPARRANSSSFEFGYKDLDGFCKAVEPVFPVKRVVRGHDHVEKGYEILPSYKNTPLMTINGLGFDHISNSVAKYRPTLVLGVGVPGQLPRPEEVAYLPEEHAGVYPLKDIAVAG
jgi:hypothetical protein